MNTNEISGGQPGFFASGKMDIGFEVGDGYVVGICLLYQSRGDQEHEYMIREKSIVKTGDRDLSACVQAAKDLAYTSAISRIEGTANTAAPSRPPAQAVPTMGAVQTQVDAPAAHSDTAAQQAAQDTGAEKPVATIVRQEATPALDPEPEDPEFDEPVDEMDGNEDSGEDGEDSDFEDDYREDDDNRDGDNDSDGGAPAQGGVQRLDLVAGLQPASNLLNNAASAQKSPHVEGADAAMQKALAMPITILGKLHSSFGKTAGEILETDPQCIVDFAHRYTGPKVEEKEALLQVYPEAVRRVQNVA